MVLGLFGVLMTLAVVGTAFVSLNRVAEVNSELATVSDALQYHKTADEMHDALRADVARAQLSQVGRLEATPAVVRRETQLHATQFQTALQRSAALRLPGPLTDAFAEVRGKQKAYILTAQAMVASALSPQGVAPGAQTDYEAVFAALVPDQNRLTERLTATTAQVQREAARKRAAAERTIGLAAAAALAGWLGLAAWHHRSMRRLQGALMREAEQRFAVDILQQGLLPRNLPAVQGAQLAACSVPGGRTQRVGGDWYDAINLPTGEVLLVVGDVAGHDLSAASAMGQLRNSLRAYALLDASPAGVLTRVNGAAHLLDLSDLATCLCAVLDPVTMRIRWASAGHPPPLVVGADGGRRLLAGEPGPPLGVIPTADYQERSVQLEYGDSLLLFSDGLVERRGVSIDVGLSTLQTVTLPRLTPEAMCEHLIATMLDGTPDHDDVTCLLVQVDKVLSRT